MITIGNCQLWVHDQDEALAFWTKRVGMEVRVDVTMPEMGGFRWLTVGPVNQPDVAIVLMTIPGPPVMDDTTAEQVSDLMAKGFAGTVFLVTDDACPDPYRFVGQRDQRDLYKYVYRSEQPNHSFEQQLFDMKTSVWRSLPRLDENALYVVFDDSMRLVRIDAGSRPWFTRDETPASPAAGARALQ